VGRGPGLRVRRQDAEGIRIRMHGLDEPIGQGAEGLAVVIGAIDDLVVDVGDVAHIVDVEPLGPQVTGHHVEHHHDPRMPEVAEVIYRHAADVHAHLSGYDGAEFVFRPGEAVVDFEHAGVTRGFV
jgi:hypothetical protein